MPKAKSSYIPTYQGSCRSKAKFGAITRSYYQKATLNVWQLHKRKHIKKERILALHDVAPKKQIPFTRRKRVTTALTINASPPLSDSI